MNRALLGLVAVVLGFTGCAGGGEPAAPKIPETPLRITTFYLNTPTIAKGEEALLCYGVEGADSVVLEPENRKLNPSLNRCIGISPSETTVYTLVAGKGAQSARSEPVELKVGAPKPKSAGAPVAANLIDFFSTSANEVGPGEKVTFCYGTKPGVLSLKLEPPVAPVKPASRYCFDLAVSQSQTYILRAAGPAGTTDAIQVSVKVGN